MNALSFMPKLLISVSIEIMVEHKNDIPILSVGNIILDSQDRKFYDLPLEYSQLFQSSSASDCQFTHPVEEDDYADPPIIGKRCQTSLSVVSRRLDLLGATDETFFKFYSGLEQTSTDLKEYELKREPADGPRFEAIAEALSQYDLTNPRPEEDLRTKKSFVQDVSTRALGNIKDPNRDHMENRLLRQLQSDIAFLDPLVILKLLARNPKNSHVIVIWNAFSEHYFDFKDDDGFDIEFGAKPRDKFMLVTEGKSDTRILERALDFYCPELRDFFTFVDMEKDYPFTGVGHLLNFYLGLQKLGVLNQMIVLFDNDVVGCAKYRTANESQLHHNIQAAKLPNLSDLEQFHCIGPAGNNISNINGTASSIECFLDLKWGTPEEPMVRWKSFIEKESEYQGALINKEFYQGQFLKISKSELSKYDSHNLIILLEHIFDIALQIAKHKLFDGYSE